MNAIDGGAVMYIDESALSPETLYAFMERIDSAPGRRTGVSHHLSVLLPVDDNGDVVYHGQITEHDRKNKSRIPFHIDFHFAKSRGLFDVMVSQEGAVILEQPTMSTSEFSELFQQSFTTKPPRYYVSIPRKCVWNATPLMDMLRFVSEAPTAINPQLHHSIRITRHLSTHDIVYHGALWIDGPPRKRKKLYDCYMDFYYSNACNIHDVKSTVKRKIMVNANYMDFEHFQKNVQNLFTPKYQTPRTFLAEPPETIRRIRSSQ